MTRERALRSSRRDSSIVGDVTVGFPQNRTGYGQQTYGNTEPQTERARWIQVHETGRATVYAGKVEYGQNIRTGLAVEVADELRLSLDEVDVVLGDTAQVPWDMGTFGSQSTARVGAAAPARCGDGAADCCWDWRRIGWTCRPDELVASGRSGRASRSDESRSVTYTRSCLSRAGAGAGAGPGRTAAGAKRVRG